MQTSHRLSLLAATLTTLTLSACSQVPTDITQPLPDPAGNRPTPQASQPAPATLQPEAELQVRLQADASLAGFATAQQSAFALCLSQISNASTRLTLPAGLPEAALTALRSGGATIETGNGQTTATIRQTLSLKDLFAGITFKLRGVPGGSIEGRTTFLDSAGAELGFVSWRAEMNSSGKQVSVQLHAGSATQAGASCPIIEATVSGASFLGAGGQVTSSQPLPNPQSNPSPAPTPSPSQSPETGPPPMAPLYVKVVEQTSTSLTVQWEFPADARSFRLYLDGQQVASDYVTPNYYRFESLRENTTYRLGVQSVNDGGSSEIVTLTTATIDGHSGSGNFSGGGSQSRPSVPQTPLPAPVPGEEILVAEVRINNPDTDIAIDHDGDVVVVWSENSYGVYARRFDRFGEPLSEATRVDTSTGSIQYDAHVASDADGDYVVVWQGYLSGLPDHALEILGQRFDKQGNPRGSEFHINVSTPGHQIMADVAMDEPGNFVVTWFSGGDIYARAYSASGRALTDEFLVPTQPSRHQERPEIAMAEDGRFVICWTEYPPPIGDNNGEIYARRFHPDGDPSGAAFLVNTYSTGVQTDCAVALDSEGDFVISWANRVDTDEDIYNIDARRFSRRGEPQGDQFRVNEVTTDYQAFPSVASDADGDFIISWVSYYYEAENGVIKALRYNSQGRALGSEFTVNAVDNGVQTYPHVAMDPDGNYAMSWQTYQDDPPVVGGVSARIYRR
ncbi:MAG: fibronectin type III domain-containing protein [Candidatus Sericytochromatia bacterium]